MHLQSTKSTLIFVFGLVASLANANPVPQLEGRTTCSLNYIPACCNFMTWESWPSIIPGLSSGCAPLASEPGGVTCPAGASAAGCCQQSPFNNAQLYYNAGNQVYCYGQ